MCTVKSVMTQLTDPKIVLQRVHDSLRKVDPHFAQEEAQYLASVEALERELGDSISPSVREYIDAKKKEITAELVYVGWLGFQQNLNCFQNPINAMFLRNDYEDFHQERRMHTLPEVKDALKTINAFYEAIRTLPKEKQDLTDGVTDYICYLETTGFKLAHYFGFLLADSFLEYVIPGYAPDPVITIQYTMGLRKYMQFDPSLLK